MEENKVELAKYNLSKDEIKRLYEINFKKSSKNVSITSLSGGVESAVYLVNDNGFKCVLKVAPKEEMGTISADKNTLNWEVKMLNLMESISFPSPKVLSFDDTCKYCDVPYFFMTYIEGDNYLEIKNSLTKSDIETIEYELGILSSKICAIKSNTFYLPSNPNLTFNNNYDFVVYLFELLLKDAVDNNLDLGENVFNIIRQLLSEKKELINNISNLCLCHTDIWDGNIIIKDGHISGIVDFSDLYYCDELMTFYFHTIDGKTSKSFLKGFGKNSLNYDEKVRIEIYRMYVILKMIVECKLKNYGKFNWMYVNLSERINNLQCK